MASVHAPIVVTHQDGLKFVAEIGDHQLVIDQPRRSGGEAAGPAPLDLLGASLGACVAFYVHQFCKVRELPYAGTRVEVTQHSAVAPSRVGRFEVHVALPPEMPEHFLPLVERAAKSCPAHNTLTYGAAVDVTIDAGVGTG
jgi:putative redox protein